MCYKMCCVNRGCLPVIELITSPDTHSFPVQNRGGLPQQARVTADSFQHQSHHSHGGLFLFSFLFFLFVLFNQHSGISSSIKRTALTLGTGSSPWDKKESVFSRENMSGKIKNTFYLCFRFLKRLF
uniref:Uncharacterized protein n=1 Tax=Molossus molossus TaxID=27622 RepID=A0A7J8EEJ0_MOLMO|nr:hypothetical protein HJG59_008875 [Molossus molossus]